MCVKLMVWMDIHSYYSISAGIPQGSVIVPMLFFLNNDISLQVPTLSTATPTTVLFLILFSWLSHIPILIGQWILICQKILKKSYGFGSKITLYIQFNAANTQSYLFSNKKFQKGLGFLFELNRNVPLYFCAFSFIAVLKYFH